jgi:lipopolysaccharide biosynthesis glycosyltransferase
MDIFIGYDSREAEAFGVCTASIGRHASRSVSVHPIDLAGVRAMRLYSRPTERRGNQLWDVISDAPMSTEFAVSRFLVPALCSTGWALFMDCDMLARGDLADLFALADPSKAVMCVQHVHEPPPGATKMDGQLQVFYARKNWSSLVLYNCDHPANKRLTVEMINTLPGRDLHRFCWLQDDEIGALPVEWNWLAGISPAGIDPKIVHYTEGGPWLTAYAEAPYADEWRAVRDGAIRVAC